MFYQFSCRDEFIQNKNEKTRFLEKKTEYGDKEQKEKDVKE